MGDLRDGLRDAEWRSAKGLWGNADSTDSERCDSCTFNDDLERVGKSWAYGAKQRK